jgi:PAS domain S-box-containing protein
MVQHELQVHQIELEMQNEQLRKTAVALEQAHARYVDLYDFAPVGYLLLDEKGRITQANLTSATLLGEERGSLVGRPLAAFVGSEDTDGWHLFFSSLVRDGERQGCALPFQLRDGTVFHAQLACQYQAAGDGESAVRVILTDVSEQRRADKTLREAAAAAQRNARELQAVLEAVPVAVLITRDREVRHLVANRHGAEMLNVAPGANMSQTAPVGERAQRLAFMKDGKAIAPNLLPVRVAATQGLEVRDFEFDVVTANGAVRHVLGNATPLRDADGELAGAVGALMDITERKEAETALQRSEERLRAFIEHASDMIVVVDGEGHVQFRSPNAAETFGRTDEEMQGQSVLKHAHPEDKARFMEAFRAVASTPGATVRATVRFQQRNGTWRIIDAVARNLLANAAVRGIVINARDVTEQRRMEEQFQHAQKLESLGRLAGGVAHDFNNLLTVILSSAEELRHDLHRDSPIQELVDDVAAAGERARALTRQLLAFARKQPVAAEIVDLNEVVRGSEPMLRRMLREDIQVDVALQPGLWTTYCDPGQVEQVVMNLAVNSRDAMMPGGGTLTIKTQNVEVGPAELSRDPDKHLGQWVRLAVGDTGCGMPPEVKAHIFEPFFTTKPTGMGTGLGLATVYGIVHQGGGHIHVRSEPGQGATVEVCFPRSVEVAQVARTTHPKATSVSGTETVLVVEDDPGVRNIVVHGLRAHGYDVLVAASGQEVRELPDDQVARLQLVVTDVIMPGLNGRAVADELRGRRPGLRVLYVSGYAQDVFADTGVVGTGAEFLAKPFTVPVLLGRVRELLDRA